MSNAGFYKITLDLRDNLFNELSSVTDFESIAKGRIGNHLVNVGSHGSGQHIRKLKIKDKVSNEEFEISLTQNSVVLFSVANNNKFLHKIVLDAAPNLKLLVADNKWLGITFRTSKTYIQFKNSLPHFPDGKLLELANKEQETEFYKLRGEENRRLDFVYPEVGYTVSTGDMMMPKGS
jgi:hypothetical protein